MAKNRFAEFNIDQQELANISKIFSHPARIAIIQVLAEKREIMTGDICLGLPISRTTVSQHLKDLKELGVIKGTIDGLKIHYCIDMQKLAEFKNMYNKFFDNTINTFFCNCE
jgi:DNA-binding transcriptional ArsR family regulator